MVKCAFSMGIFGMDAFLVEIEADLSSGLPAFDLVGLPDAAVRESRDRVRAAIKNCGFEFPVSRITMNLAPANMKKEGPIYDLPLFIALVRATGQLKVNTDDSIFLGELSLSGKLRPVLGALPMAIKARELGFKSIFLPSANAPEAAVVSGLNVLAADSVFEVLEHLRGNSPISPTQPSPIADYMGPAMPDFADVKGQHQAKRALEIAASGGHNLLMIGPPGSGKSMLAKRLPSILPDMSFDESIETTKIHSIAGRTNHKSPFISLRPFRSPHHTISPNGLTGGGSNPRPGEISLAHNGVLFLDEFPEFSRPAMEMLRQPLEDGTVTISRVLGSVSYPCNFMLVAAMNPCPCGYFGHPTRMCSCSPSSVSRYLAKISGPLLDRLDLHVEVPPVEYDQLANEELSEASREIKKRVNRARAVQLKRLEGTGISCNASMTPDLLRENAKMTQGAKDLLHNAFEKFGFSARAYDRIVKVARTIADLEDSPSIESSHTAEAVGYRNLDRKYWMDEL